MNSDFKAEVDRLRRSFNSGKTKQISWRKEQLWNMLAMIRENKSEICEAVKRDLNKHPIETELMEIAGVQNEIIRMLNNIDSLAKPLSVKKSILGILNTLNVRKEPFGVCLDISAWNYPILLSLQPMVGAIAAGNCVMLKPSEIAEATAVLLQKLIPKYLDNSCFSVVVTGPEGSSNLLKSNRFDVIIYTGGSFVAKLIMKAVSEHLTPLILELGGKNPCYVDRSSDLMTVARRITWGKWTNAGQICISPDYIMCEEGIKDELVRNLKTCITEFYGEDPRKSDGYSRIVNVRHFNRLKNLLQGVNVLHGGIMDENERYFSPTIVDNVGKNAPVRDQEIFGPILPIYTISSLDEAINIINQGERSLSLSVFAKDRKVIDRIVMETSTGGITVNDLLMQKNELDLPFGGVGDSGMGLYHGKFSFDSFTHLKSYYESNTPEMLNSLKYPPYSEGKAKLLRPFIYSLIPSRGPLKHFFCLCVLGLIGALAAYLYSILI